MTRSRIDSLVTEKALNLVNDGSTGDFLEMFLNSDPEIGEGVIQDEYPDLKNVCAKVSAHLSDEIDSVVGLLGVSKRRFLEYAFIDALRASHEILKAEGVWDALEEQQAVREAAKAAREAK